jgi:predicted restriction endonuclease
MHSNSLKNLKSFPKGHKLGVGNKYRLGKKLSPEHAKALRNSRLGKKNSIKQREAARKTNLGNKHFAGKKHSAETKKKISDSKQGEKNHFWAGGVSTINHRIRQSAKYRDWRTAVFERDNYTCVNCGINRNNQKEKRMILNADHIKPFAIYKELRFDLDNGRTLCIDCHKATDTFGSRSRSKHK